MLRDRFEIEYEIGGGAHGTVFKGLDLHTGQPVAIKRLKSDLASAKMLERFRREGEALLQLNHPNVVKFVDAFEDSGQHYLVLEYVDGNNLNDTIRHKTLDLPRIIDIALDIADALTRAHRLNIIHRDIKPSNILINKIGGVYLTDFGVAALGNLPDLTGTDGVIGTFHYLSPEILEGQSISEKSDIWAFGIVLYEMLTGERPFQGKMVSTLLKAILYDPVPDLEAITDGVPVALIDLIYRMLEKDEMFRIPSVRLVGVELEALKKGYVPYSPRQLKHQKTSTTNEPRFSEPQSERQTLHNLPSSMTPFVGREAELYELERILFTDRLVSLVGGGGMGKTRLALEVAHQQLRKWEHGVYFVDLASVTRADDIPYAVASAVDLQFHQGPPQRQQILNYLRTKKMMLIMDNFEHVLAGVDLLDELLQHAPDITVLATSRERLNLQSETVVNIGGMDFPDWETPDDALDYSAVKLFLQSAQRVNFAYELHPEDLPYVARICRLVEGMPLGVLLAASWADLLTPREIANEIEQNVDFLASDARDLPERQRSIQAVFDYSWNLMGADEQTVFAKLSVFQGGFALEAAQETADASLRDLQTLVRKSFLHRDVNTGRYMIHELHRQYAARVLETSEMADDIADRHSLYYLDFLITEGEALYSEHEEATVALLGTEFENIQKAWYRALANHNYMLLEDALWKLEYYLKLDSKYEVQYRIWQDTVNLIDDKSQSMESYVFKAFIQIKSTVFAVYVGKATLEECNLTVQQYSSILDTHGSIKQRLDLYINLAYIAEKSLDFKTGRIHIERALHLARAINDSIFEINTLYRLAVRYLRPVSRQQANFYASKALQLACSLSAPSMIREVFYAVILTMEDRGEQKEALQKLVKCNQKIENESALCFGTGNLGWELYRSKQFTQAKHYILEATTKAKLVGYPTLETETVLGFVEQALDNYIEAKQLVVQIIGQLLEHWFYRVGVQVLILITSIITEDDNIERAIELLGLYSTYPPEPNVDFAAFSLHKELRSKVDKTTFEIAFQRGTKLDITFEFEKIFAEWASLAD